jgi:hypothetical protein
MAAGDIKFVYVASVDLTVTNLHSLASSPSHTSGWESPEIDNSTNKYLDYLISGKLTVGSPSADAEIRIWVVAKIADDEWPGGFDGTESAETTPLDDANGTQAGAILLKTILTDNTAAQVYKFHALSVASAFGGVCPEKFVIFITQSTGVNFAASGNRVVQKGVYQNVAA